MSPARAFMCSCACLILTAFSGPSHAECEVGAYRLFRTRLDFDTDVSRISVAGVRAVNINFIVACNSKTAA